MTEDRTMTEDSLFGSARWCAVTLGRSYDWFITNRDKLEAANFPKKDCLTGLYLKSDVQDWIQTRAQRRAKVELQESVQGVNYDCF